MKIEDDTILLVEDNPKDVLLIQRAFCKANIANPLQVVEDGEAAIRYLLGEEYYSDRTRYPIPILILLDLKLPRKSGAEVLAWLRQQPELKRLSVVVLTSSKEMGIKLPYLQFSSSKALKQGLQRPKGAN